MPTNRLLYYIANSNKTHFLMWRE